MAAYPPLGKVFGRLTVIGSGFSEGKNYFVPVRCVCGTEKRVGLYNLLKGTSQSCGCLHRELLSVQTATHRLSGTPIYIRWAGMVGRCHNPQHSAWKRYGARGIKVCRRWRSFENFYADMGDPPFPGASIERKKNHLGYSKANCVWATKAEQALNKTNSIRHVFRGRKRPLLEIAKMTGIKYMTLYNRLFTYGWSLEEAVKA